MLADALLQEFDHEMRLTRTLLARVPDDRATWKPHAKSMSMGELAMHLATLTNYAVRAVRDTELDFDPKGGSPRTSPQWQSSVGTLALFDGGVDEAHRAIAAATDVELRVPWTLRAGDHVIFTMPRIGVLRTLVLNHLIHHRGQLSVYLRLNDIPVPSIYGRSADEQ